MAILCAREGHARASAAVEWQRERGQSAEGKGLVRMLEDTSISTSVPAVHTVTRTTDNGRESLVVIRIVGCTTSLLSNQIFGGPRLGS